MDLQVFLTIGAIPAISVMMENINVPRIYTAYPKGKNHSHSFLILLIQTLRPGCEVLKVTEQYYCKQ